MAMLHQAYKWYRYGNKNAICVPNVHVLIMKAYRTYMKSVGKVRQSLIVLYPLSYPTIP